MELRYFWFSFCWSVRGGRSWSRWRKGKSGNKSFQLPAVFRHFSFQLENWENSKDQNFKVECWKTFHLSVFHFVSFLQRRKFKLTCFSYGDIAAFELEKPLRCMLSASLYISKHENAKSLNAYPNFISNLSSIQVVVLHLLYRIKT